MFGYIIYITLLIKFINKVIITKQRSIKTTPMSCGRRAPQIFCLLSSWEGLFKLNFRQMQQILFYYKLLK